MDTNLTFGEWLADALRDRDNMTQGEFAARVGVSQTAVSSWANNDKRPSRQNCRRIASVLGVEYDDVLVAAGYTVGAQQAFDVAPRESSVRSDQKIYQPPTTYLDIDLDDPLVSFAAYNQHLLTDRQKQAMIDFAKAWLADQQERERRGE